MIESKRAISVCAGFLVLFLSASSANASLLTFDDQAGSNDLNLLPSPWDYGGLTFTANFLQYTVGDDAEQGAKDGTSLFIYGYDSLTVTKTGGGEFTLNQFDFGLSFFTDTDDQISLTLNFAGGGSSTQNLSATQSFDTLVVGSPSLVSFELSNPLTSDGYVALDNIDYTAGVSPVPEPSSMVLLGAGILGILGYRRRRTI